MYKLHNISFTARSNKLWTVVFLLICCTLFLLWHYCFRNRTRFTTKSASSASSTTTTVETVHRRRTNKAYWSHIKHGWHQSWWLYRLSRIYTRSTKNCRRYRRLINGTFFWVWPSYSFSGNNVGGDDKKCRKLWTYSPKSNDSQMYGESCSNELKILVEIKYIY